MSGRIGAIPATHDRKAERAKAVWPELTIIPWAEAGTFTKVMKDLDFDERGIIGADDELVRALKVKRDRLLQEPLSCPRNCCLATRCFSSDFAVLAKAQRMSAHGDA
jgi:hypothetical protein